MIIDEKKIESDDERPINIKFKPLDFNLANAFKEGQTARNPIEGTESGKKQKIKIMKIKDVPPNRCFG